MKLESMKSSKFEALSADQMTLVNGGAGSWSRTGAGEWEGYGYSKSDWDYYDNGKLLCTEVLLENGRTVDIFY